MIGILAGMGPKSTGPFVDKVVEECQSIYGAKHDMDFPPMMVYSCPTPFYLDKPLNHQDMETAIIAGAQKLEKTGVDFIAMPCNTAHLYFDQIERALSVPLINMIDETVSQIPNHSKRVALLATHPTIQSGVYQAALSKIGIEVIHKEHWQGCVNQMIALIKAGQLKQAVPFRDKLLSELAKTVDTAIIACTDLNAIPDHPLDSIGLVDSSTCLARAVVHHHLARLKS
ncbi:aspartate/glutamate racemase family protein [Gorillibacterium sp. sgz500922]|uniref:aspartate/glutamate racemase family protein n=1 Tax=Gorillibacterium sp. sgz500922 TaxID=3446694 RepID=UPI003F66E587